MKIRVVCIQEGLGNQMFQYAFYRVLRAHYPHDFVVLETSSFRFDRAHNGYELGKVFGIEPHCLSDYLEERKLSHLHGLVRGVYEKGMGQFMELNHRTLRPIVFYRGFWQSWQYAERVREVLNERFCFREELLSVRNRLFAAQISGEESVAIHIRAGDYYSNSEANALLGGICDVDYYRQAVLMLKNRCPHGQFYIFTNEPTWVQEYLPDLEGALVDWNKGEDSWCDLYLMSRCRHAIIANSSFSWWGAWLGEHSKQMVIAPKHWFRGVEKTDIIPKRWIQI